MKNRLPIRNNSQKSTKAIIKFPELEGDSYIYLGQAIVTLIRMGLENNVEYSLETQHRFKVELMASVLTELNVSLDDLKREYESRNSKDV